MSEEATNTTTIEATATAEAPTTAETPAPATETPKQTAKQKLADMEARATKAEADLKTANDKVASLEADLATAKKDVEAKTTEIEAKTAEIEKLKADAKTAEQIAAEKYGASVSHKTVSDATTGVDTASLQSRYDAVKDNPAKRGQFMRKISQAERDAIKDGSIKQ